MKNRKSDEKFGGENNIGDIIEQLAYRGDLKFRLSAMLYKGVSESRDYGDGEPLKMLDAHILVDIDQVSRHTERRSCAALVPHAQRHLHHRAAAGG